MLERGAIEPRLSTLVRIDRDLEVKLTLGAEPGHRKHAVPERLQRAERHVEPELFQ